MYYYYPSCNFQKLFPDLSVAVPAWDLLKEVPLSSLPLLHLTSGQITGEGNGNPLQCSCLENPRDRGAWWAAVYGVPQSQTELKQLSSSSK